MAARWITGHRSQRHSVASAQDDVASTPSSDQSKKVGAKWRLPLEKKASHLLVLGASAITHKMATLEHKAAKAKLVDSWWTVYYHQRKNDLRTPSRQVGRSDKHDYRNPDSKYENDIVDLLRRSHAEEAEELDRHQELHPFLSKDYLKALQRFRLLPPWDEADDDDAGETRLRARSDASELRSRPASMMASLDDDGHEASGRPQTEENSNEDVVKLTHILRSSLNPSRSFNLRQRVSRWTHNNEPFRQSLKGNHKAACRAVGNLSPRQTLTPSHLTSA